MNVNREIELLENSQVKLTVRVPAEDVGKEYDELVREYCGKVHLKGFRKGKAPAELVIRKLGSSLIEQTRVQVMEKSLAEIWKSLEQKPIPNTTPEVDAHDILLPGKDFAFKVVYDTWPVIELAPYTGLEIDEPEWEIDDEDIGRELKKIQKENALYTDREGGSAETGNIVNIDYYELDENGAEKAGTRREAFVFELGTGYNVYKLDDELAGMSKGEQKTVTRTFAPDFEIAALAGKTVRVHVTLNSIKEKKLPEINDELAQDISDKFQTLDDLKAEIRKKLGEAVTEALRSKTVQRVLDSVIETSKIPLPRSIVEYQLNAMWREYLRQLGITEKKLTELMDQEGRSMDDLRAEWTPAAERRAKLQLAISEICKREGIAIEESDLDMEIAKIAERRKVAPEELKQNLAENRLIDYMKSNLRMDKLYDFLRSRTVVRKGEKRKVLDILTGN